MGHVEFDSTVSSLTWRKILMFFKYSILNQLLNLIAPIECLHCGSNDHWCCPACQKILTPAQPIIIENYSPAINRVICAYNYKNQIVQKLIHACKYDGIKETTNFIAEQLSIVLGQQLQPEQNYLLLPVPLHPQRQRQRGFNQSQIIAEVVAKNLNLKIINGQRVINTPHQVGLNGPQRQKNMKDVFSLLKHNLDLTKKSTTIIIVDDVITTGATINSLAEKLSVDYKNIWAIALAKE